MPITNNQLFNLPSSEVDKILGYRIDEIEHNLFLAAKALRPDGDLKNLGHVLHGGNQTWVGLDPQTLNTPYAELKLLCEILRPRPNELMVDLGAGHGRLGAVLALLYPEVSFIGYELVEERVKEGLRIFKELGYQRGNMITADLTNSFKIPPANFYFIYDYGKVAHIRQTLKELEELANTQNFRVIARGKGVRSIIEYEHPWLAGVYPVHHEENFSIYSMTDLDSHGPI